MPGVIGAPIEDLDTPALLLDAQALEGNIRRMAEFFRGRSCQLRPHFKNHKCTRIARRQLDAGSAVGITCAKLGEAEVLADAGAEDILIANQVVGRRKLNRLVNVACRTHLRVAVDHMDQATAISEAADAAGVTVGVLVEVDIGMGRCGLPPGEPALQLARAITKLPGIRFDGIQAYEGHLVSVPDADERFRRTRDAMQQALDTRRRIEKAGIPAPIVSGGSSSTYKVTGTLDGMNEIQAGTYVTMDCSYRQLAPEFEQALSVLARVISRPRADTAVLDVGVKGVGHEFGPPQIKDRPEASVPRFQSEEHCVVQNVADWRIGQAVELIPSHACTTCNLHRQFMVHDAGRVVDVWPIEGSGRLT
jgi:D-serine deaminase-like pyridoxal phosphate-dependent protein